MKKTIATLFIAIFLTSLFGLFCFAAVDSNKKIDLSDYTKWSFGGKAFTQPKGTLSHGNYDIGSQGVTLNTTGKGSEFYCNISTQVQQVDFSKIRFLNFKIKTASGTDFWDLKIVNKDTTETYDYAIKQANLGDQAWRGVQGDREGALKIPDNWKTIANIEITFTGMYFMDVSESATIQELELSDTERSLKTSGGQTAVNSQVQSKASSTAQAETSSNIQTQSIISESSISEVIKTPGFTIEDALGEKGGQDNAFSLFWFLIGTAFGILIGFGAYFIFNKKIKKGVDNNEEN